MLRLGIVSTLLVGAFLVHHPNSGGSPALHSKSAPVGVQDENKAKEDYEALGKQFDAAMLELRTLVKNAESKDKQVELLATKNPGPTFARKYFELAKKYPDTKVAVNSILFAVGQTKGEQKNEAMSYLIQNYPNKVRLDKMAESFKTEVPSPEIETWYQLMCEKAEKPAIRASVMFDYAKYVSQIPTFQKTLAINPVIAGRLPKAQLDYINATRTDEQNKKVAAYLQSVIDEHGDLKKGRSTYGDLAKRELYDLLNLQVGQKAPEIEGEDLDGIPFKLSDYRGKVVMLDFWGHWCPPCRAMYSHEQEIVRKLADKPFVLLGVNSDQEFDTVKEAVQDESLSWRHFWNGPKGTNGPIARQWNVEGWPTVYLIDENGIIRYKEVLGKDIDLGIEKLMAEMGYEVKLTEDTSE